MVFNWFAVKYLLGIKLRAWFLHRWLQGVRQ